MRNRRQSQLSADTPFDIDKVTIRRGTRLQGGDWTFRAFYKSKRIGYLMISPFKLEGHPPEDRAPWKAAVAEGCRREGVATKLYDTAEAWLRERGLILVPGLGLDLYCVSDDAYKFWLNRAPDHPAVLNDARRFEEQFAGKAFPYKGDIWTIDHTAGRHSFLIRNAAGDRTSIVKAPLVWEIYGKPGEPKEDRSPRWNFSITHSDSDTCPTADV